MVKVFPVKFHGPEYIKEIKGPLNDVELLACGGIKAENIKDFFLNGASGFAFGRSIFKNDWMIPERLFEIESSISKLISRYNE